MEKIFKNELFAKIVDLSLREVDLLLAKYFFGFETKIDRVESKNSNNIKYLYLPKSKRKYARHFSKSKTKTEKINDKYRPLPRWSTDLRDCYKLLIEANKRFGQFQILFIDENNVSVVGLNHKFTGKFSAACARLILFLTLAEKEKK